MSNPNARTASECHSWNVMVSSTVAAPRRHPFILSDQFQSAFTPDSGNTTPELESNHYPSISYMSQLAGSPSSLPTFRFAKPQTQATSRPGPWESSPRNLHHLWFSLHPVTNQWSDPGQLEERPFDPHSQEGKQTPSWELPPDFPHLYLLQITGACCVSPHHVTPGGTQPPYLPPAWLMFRHVHGHPATCNHTRHSFCQWDKKTQVDIAVLDYVKTVDEVPHRSLLNKLHQYGIDNNIHTWIMSFLNNRIQSVVVDSATSPPTKVIYGVPQRTVLRPLLFLLYTNDQPPVVSSQVRLFANDCILYRAIQTIQDSFKKSSTTWNSGPRNGEWGLC